MSGLTVTCGGFTKFMLQRKHYVNMAMQNHGASYHGIFAIITGINDESLKQFSCEHTLFNEKAAGNHIQQNFVQIYQKFVQL